MIEKTNDYSIFKKHENNRIINDSNLKKLILSIKTQNMLEFCPLLVDEDMRIIDGQHRLEAARTLGVEVFYRINKKATHHDIVLLNANQKKWESSDWVNYYVSLGKEEYIKLKKYAESRKISIAGALKILRTGSGGYIKSIKKGSFKFLSAEDQKVLDSAIDNAAQFIEHIAPYLSSKKVIYSQKFNYALTVFLKNPLIALEKLKDKATYKANIITPRADYNSYINMLKDIYNWRNNEPID